jgi:acetylornithine/N-succinyldiaminopimelate aminotransferase
MDHGFHGRTLATMAASGKSQWEQLYEPKVPGFVKVPLNDLAALEAAITPRTVAVMLEPIQGEAGVFETTIPFLRSLRALTREKGLLLILDEIQTGIGRTGRMFGFEHAGTTPDIMTLAKGLGGGVPLAALVAHRDVCCFDYGDQGGTFCGNPLMAAAGCAVIEEVAKPGFLARVTQAGDYLANCLRTLSQKYGGGEVRGQGLLRALDLKRDVATWIADQRTLFRCPAFHAGAHRLRCGNRRHDRDPRYRFARHNAGLRRLQRLQERQAGPTDARTA